MKTASRRNSTARTGLLFIILLLIIPVAGSTQELRLQIQPSRESYNVSLSLEGYRADDILSSLQEGLRAEISYQIRIYRKTRGIFSILGDRLVEEANPKFEAKWDIFSRNYVIEDEAGNTHYFRTQEEFITSFFALDTYEVDFPISDPSSFYILAQSNIRSMKLVPPFTLLSVLFPLGSTTTSWERGEFISSRIPR